MLLNKNERFLDIGAGIGYFSLPAAEIVGNEGMVFAVDTSEEMLEELRNKLKDKSITNITTFQGKDYNTDIANQKVDYIFLSNVLHEVEDKMRFLNNYLEKLKTGGKLGIIEFKKINTPKGPPIQHKIGEDELKAIYEKLNIDIIKEVDINDYQYGIVGKKTK
jgi:ubiquinone/menaquinone biosynthesis C-methylase UbiE